MGNKPKPKPKPRQPFYLNWVLWLTLSISLVAVSVGLLIAFGPVAIIVPIVAIATVVSATAGPVIGAWEKVNEKLKEVHERAEKAEEKAYIEGERNTKIEGTAVLAATTALALSNKVDVNAERSDLLEKRYEALSDMAYQLTENLQQERIESKLVTAELKAQNHQQQAEINELKEQIRLMGVEKSGDKQKIIRLESQVKQLQEQVKELQERENQLNEKNLRLEEENYQLKYGLRRRSTDQLTGLSPDAERRLAGLAETEAERKD